MFFPISKDVHNLSSDSLEGRSPPDRYVCTIIMLLCAFLSAIILPGIFLVAIKCYPPEAPPLGLMSATSSGIFGKIMAETHSLLKPSYDGNGTLRNYGYITDSHRINLIMRLQGLAFAIVSLGATFLLDTKTLDCTSGGSCQTRFRAQRTLKLLILARNIYDTVIPQVCFMKYP